MAVHPFPNPYSPCYGIPIRKLNKNITNLTNTIKEKVNNRTQ